MLLRKFCVVSCFLGFLPQIYGEYSPYVIVDNDERIPVGEKGFNIPQKFQNKLSGFGLMRITLDDGVYVCSATCVGGGLAITAGHCFKPEASPRNDQVESCEFKWSGGKCGKI